MLKADDQSDKEGMEGLVITNKERDNVGFHCKRQDQFAVSGSEVISLPQKRHSKHKKGFFKRIRNERLKNLDYLIDEQFKALKIRILKKHDRNPPRVLLVVSAFASEGKSTVATNLAISLAKGVNEHAILIDCDFRKPGLHKRFGLNPEKGLADYLLGHASSHEVFFNTKIPKLTLIPVGTQPSNSLELLSSERMSYFIKELSSRYSDRYIVIDTSPIQLTSEPMVLLSQADGIIMVVRAGKTNRETVLRILEDMEKEKFLGVVLNGLERSLSTRYYYNYYQYY